MKRRKAKAKNIIVLNEVATAPSLSTFKANLSGPDIRHETLEGRKYLVAPVVMLMEGVHNGSEGPLFYSAEEIEKTAPVWNHKPIVVYHPTINGKGVSACSPTILEKRKIGIILNTKFDGRLASEAWLDIEKTKKVDSRILDMLEKKQMVEVSTGLWTENKSVEKTTWNGEEYETEAHALKPDHLAILPDQVGACSIADGAGLLRNEVSFDAVRSLLDAAIREYCGAESYCYVVDVFKGFVVYACDRELCKQAYTATDTTATLVGEPEEVVRVTQYQTPDGTVVANKVFKLEDKPTVGESNKNKVVKNKKQNKETTMNKAAMIALLIANSSGLWSESEREFLEKQDEKRLKGFVDAFTDNGEKNPEKNKQTKTEPTPVLAPVANTVAATSAQPKVLTEEEYIAAAPAGIRDMLTNAKRIHEAEKAKLIAVITGNTRSKFSKEYLESRNIEELQGIAELAAPVTPVANKSVPIFSALADASMPTGSSMPAPLAAAKIDWKS